MNSIPDTNSSSPRDILANLISPVRNQSRVIWTAIIGIVIVFTVGLLIRHSHFDLAVVQYLNDHHHGTIGSITNAVYKFFGPLYAILGVVVVTGIIVAVSRSLRVSSTFAATIAATWLSMAAVKLIVHRLRPDPSLLSFPFNPAQIDASYPSGHTAFITALVVTLFLGVAINRRWLVAFIGGLFIVLVGLSVIVDGIHFPSDVIASVIWGIVVAPFARMLWVSVVLGTIDKMQLRRNQNTQKNSS